MLKKIILVLPCFAFLLSFNLAWASLIINEIMYDLEGADTGREWIEIYNDSDAAVNISSWKFFEADTNHGLVLTQGDASIGAKGYAVIVSDPAKFKTDWSNFAGTIFDSSFSLDNDGEPLALKDADLKVVNQYTYSSLSGGQGDGKSLQRISGSWVATIPTPGKTNEMAVPPTAPPPEAGGGAVSSAPQPTGGLAEIRKIKTKITVESISFGPAGEVVAFVGIPVLFEGSATGYYNEPLFYGRYFWNFGDGDSKEAQAREISKFPHTFFYEGEYAVSLEYYGNYYFPNPNASDRIIVKVVRADIVISKIGDRADFFVEISNNTPYNADLSGWVLLGDGKSFVIPRGTVVETGKKLILSPQVTGLSISDKNYLRLTNKEGATVFAYAPSVKPTPVSAKKSASSLSFTAESAGNVAPTGSMGSDENGSSPGSGTGVLETGAPVPDLSAKALGGYSSVSDTRDSLKYLAGLVLFIGVGASAAYFIRRRGRKLSSEEAGNDFEIMDE